ncbi:protoporphyrinogen oxidase [Bacillus benzoevorans]|uniref:Coproporphyrinogen III oxidase n=1 Tax=Bacillus benzoevorans TaxID=1456 RepID=A0A7X0HMD6_9BACI|nr:oxygen-dependent protoporphyrinogen oxidase [Bacillus benzoevorans]
MSDNKKRAVIIGGGITGLTAAYYLQKEAREKSLPIEVVLVEASQRLGGKMQTFKKDGYVIERGPDSFLERKTSAARLAKEVGMDDKLVNNAAGKSYVLVKDRLHPMPGGAIMGIPTELGPFITTGLFSMGGKLRAAGDFILPRSRPVNDQSLGTFFRRRLGDEVVENLIEPLLSGIYSGDIDEMSLMSTFPQYYALEQKYRSLVLGMKKTTPRRPKSTGIKKKGIFLSFKTGLRSFADAIEAKLDPGSIKKGFRAEKISQTNEGYKIELNGSEALYADSIIMAVSHQTVYSIFPEYEFFQGFKNVPSTSVATVALGFPKEAVTKDIDGTGFVVSRNGDYSITACTWVHKKWPHSTPEGKVLLRCYVGRAGDEAVVDLSDDEIVHVVLEDLAKTMDISMEPELVVISRWHNAMPQYTVGHKDRMERATNGMLKELPGIFLAGCSYNGLGMPDCIDQGEDAVKKVLKYLHLS